MLISLLALATIGLGTGPVERPRFYILAVGIKEYNDQQTGFGELAGPRDAKLFVEGMKKWYGANRRDDVIEILDTPAQNTRKAVWDALQRMATQAKPTDAIVFFYSGHGTQIFDATKPTQRSQAIVPIDVKRKGGIRDGEIVRDSVIAGPDFAVILKTLGDRKANNVTMFFDSCHSESISRGALRKKAGVPDAALAKASPAPESNLTQSNETGWEFGKGLAIFSATRAGWSAWEKGEKGFFTTSLFSAMSRVREQGGPVSCATVFDLVRADVKRLAAAEKVDQEPQFEGNEDRALFDTAMIDSEPSHKVFVNGESLKVEAGELQAIQTGFVMGLYPATTNRFDGEPAYRAIVESVDATESRLRLVDEKGEPVRMSTKAPLGGYRAVVIDGFPSGRVKVRIDGSIDAATRKQIEAIRVIEVVDAKSDYDLLVSAPGQSLNLLEDAEPGAWHVGTASGTVLLTKQGSPDAGFVTQLKVHAVNAAKRKTLLGLGPSGGAQVGIEAELVKVKTSGPYKREATVEVLPQAFQSLEIKTQSDPVGTHYTERFAIRVRTVQVGEQAAYAPYITLMDLMPDGKIDCIWPVNNSNTESARLPTHGKWMYLGNNGTLVDGSQPDRVEPFYVDQKDGGAGLEVLKLFATERPDKFTTFLTEGAKSRSADSPLARILGSVWDEDPLAPISRAGGAGRGSSKWAVAQLHLYVDSKPR